MKIYSIKEIVEASNNILKPRNSNIENKQKEKKKIENKTDIFKTPLVLNNEISRPQKNEISSINHQVKIRPEIKDEIINEIYLFLKKKVKKNTLKIIIDEQLEIKNLKNQINFLKIDKGKLFDDYRNLEKKYGIGLENYEKIKIENQNIIKVNNELKYNLSKISGENSQLSMEIKDLKSELNDKDLYIDSTNKKNRSFEINNAELKNTISRYVINTKKLKNEIDEIKNFKENEMDEKNKKIKFYQDENVRLSGDLISFQRKNENIRLNLNDIELEKQKISDKIKELNKSIEEKTNIVSTNFVNEPSKKPKVEESSNLSELNESEQKSLDEVISRIFKKI